MHDDLTDEDLVIDAAMPTYDVVIAEHAIVRASVERTFAAARGLDFLRVHSPAVDAALWVRGVPAKWRGTSRPPARLVLAEGDPLPGWMVLGERTNREIAFGAVGKFWQLDIEWRDLDPGDFATFADAGWGKIAANLTTLPYGAHATLLTYECRTVTTDAQARARFLRYWWIVRPFVAHIFRATVRTIRDDAERGLGARGSATGEARARSGCEAELGVDDHRSVS